MKRVVLAGFTLALLAASPYWRSLGLPWISDDYLLIRQAREWGPPSGWAALADDALYRSRALSFVSHRAFSAVVGETPLAAHLQSLFWHILVCWAIALLGSWQAIGWRLAWIAAAFFAVYEGHQEAVIWYSALPDLQCCFFVIVTVLAYAKFTECGRWFWYAGSIAAFAFALLSKEPGVTAIPLMAWAGWRQKQPLLRLAATLAAPVLIAVYYTAAILAASETHQHLNDGTFSLSAPFVRTWVISYTRLLWFWGLLSLLVLAWKSRPAWRRLESPIWLALYWIAVTLPPYCFLLYMPRIPSRHTYLPSVGLALLCAVAFLWVYQNWPKAAFAVAAVVVVHNAGYVLYRKHHQFAIRAESTESLLRYVRKNPGQFVITEFPYNQQVVSDTLTVMMPERAADAIWSPGRPRPPLPAVRIDNLGVLTVQK